MTSTSHLTRHPSHPMVDDRQQRYLAGARRARLRRGLRSDLPSATESRADVRPTRTRPRLRLVAHLEPRPSA